MSMPLKVLKEAIKKRDDILAQYEKAAGDAIDVLAGAREAKDLTGAVRLAFFGEKDFAQSKKVADFRTAHGELKKEEGYKEALGVLKSERDYRSKIAKALKRELQIDARRKKGSKATYKSVVKIYEQVLSSAPGVKAAASLKKHIDELRAKD